MKRLCRERGETVPEPRILQFGEGNFLRGFVDYMVDAANERGVFSGGVVIVKPKTRGGLTHFTEQDCVYTVILRDSRCEERRIVSCVTRIIDPQSDPAEYNTLPAIESLRFIVSNTTEAGIVFDDTDSIEFAVPNTYPGKLTKLLYERYKKFSGDSRRGFIVLPVELIERNGEKLRECVLKYTELWKLPDGFKNWVIEHNIFCSTLVDRIITGYPAAEQLRELGYEDKLAVCGEPYSLWVIQSDRLETVRAEFPLDSAGLEVVFTNDERPYRERKVRILNGAHTVTVPAAFLAGLNTIGECVSDDTVRAFMHRAVYDEITRTVNLPYDEVAEFADSVFQRFSNPYIEHKLISIALNSVSKWRTRVLPSLKDYCKQTGQYPKCLTFSFAALTALYSQRVRDGERYEITDDESVLEFFKSAGTLNGELLIRAFAARVDFWGEDLSDNEFCAIAGRYLDAIYKDGARAAMRMCL